MKKTINLLAVVCAAGMMAACSGTAKDSTSKADSANGTKDSLDNKQQGTGELQISDADAKFAVEAANGGLAEVELGSLAQQKAVNAQVKDFGKMMVNDHTKANMELKALADSKKITLPDSAGGEEAAIKTKLQGKSGKEFDKAYVEAMVNDHKKDIQAFEEARKKVKYPEMTAFIDKTLPVLKMHLQAISKIQKDIDK
jgi:putative membrane protein